MAQQQTVPVRVYQTDSRIMVAAPLPGLEPEDIAVTIDADQVTIRGERRGARQDEKGLVTAEWEVGPYYREVRLPQPVDGALANASYGNGVLVLALPKLASGQRGSRVQCRLDPLSATRGERVGHEGHDIQPTTTEEHADQVTQTAQSAGAHWNPHDRRAD